MVGSLVFALCASVLLFLQTVLENGSKPNFPFAEIKY